MFCHLKKVLIQELGYPASIDELKRKSEYLMRGLHIDPKIGRLLEIGEYFSVQSASVGLYVLPL